MEIAEIKITSWGKIQYCELPNDPELKKGDLVILKANGSEEFGQYIGNQQIKEENIIKTSPEEIGENGKNGNGGGAADKITIESYVSRKATKDDLEKLPSFEEKERALQDCQKLIEKHKLPMKLIDVHFSFDTSKVTFAFSAEGRVDFRLLVRDLTGHFNRTIRLHQIGKRDEAKAIGDCGPCGRILCCKSFIKDFASITSKMAETQQVVHRGSERISGLCSRLKCCLQYEQEGYKELAKKLPNIGEEIEVEGEKATVVNCNVLKQTVDARFKNHSNGENHGDTVMEVDIENYTKKEK